MHNSQTDPSINPRQRLSEKSFYPWFIWTIAALFFFLQYLARVAPSMMESQLMQSFHLNAFQYGMLGGFFYYAYLFMQIPSGALIDRLKARYLLSSMAALAGLGCYLFAYADTYFIAAIGRLITGFSGAFAFVGAMKVASIWFPPTYLGLLAGATQALGMVGAAVGDVMISHGIQSIGWRSSMWIIGDILFILGIIFFIFLRDKPDSSIESQTSNPASKIKTCDGFKVIACNPQTWLNGFYAGLMFAPTEAFSENWGPSFFVHVHGFNSHTAATMNMLIFLGLSIGCPLMGRLSDIMGKRKPTMLLSSLLSAIILGCILYAPPTNHPWLLYLLLFTYGLISTGVVNAYAIAAEMNPLPITGLSVAFANMASVIIGVLFIPLIGYLLDRQWTGLMDHGIRLYSHAAYYKALFMLPMCFGVALVVLYFIEETHCKNHAQRNAAHTQKTTA
jgi:MFS family permease